MPTKKYKQKLLKHQIYSIARVVACASFLVLAIIGVSSLVKAMSLETIANENGVPANWQASSLGNPDTITVDATYWDQRQDSCDDPNRQFEWVICGYWTAGAIQGIIKDTLGTDGLPVPAYTNSTDAWNANRDVFTANVTGQDPVQPGDNFYRWFHETDKSKQYDRQVTFTRTGTNTYTYGREGVFPLDNVDFSNDDEATKQGHNYHFTSHLSFAMKVAADGKEKFEFSGDDDVWVFLNGKLILDIGGLHEKLNGWFTINPDGTVSTYVQNVNDVSGRAALGQPSNDFNGYVDPLNQLNRATFKDKYQTIDVGIKEGDVVNLDFFYAERSTTESNTKITISNMNWPISADSDIEAKIVGKIENTENNIIQYHTSISNRDPEHPLDLERLAAYITETSYPTSDTSETIEGYLPLDSKTLYYTKTPNDNNSWQPVEISAPANNENGFKLATSLRMSPAGTDGDTLYFRYFSETSGHPGITSSLVSYYTSLEGVTGVTYDYDSVEYSGVQINPTPDPYILTIKYLYEDESEAKPPVVKSLYSGDDYSVDTIDDIPGFTPDIMNIRGTIPENPTYDDLNYVVYYRPKPVIPVDPEPVDPVDPEEPEEKTYTITIHYVYDEDGSTAAPDYISEELKPGESDTKVSPVIPNYTPDESEVTATVVDSDIVITVRYKKNPEPVTPPVGPTNPVNPDLPEEPENPEQPDVPEVPDLPDEPQPEEPDAPDMPTPTPPTIPGSDVINGDLLYLAPLGEVAFVPNTGVVSDIVASVFEAGFAEVVLSQAFVMIVLFVFASSFSTYFSLRQYAALPTMANRGQGGTQNRTKKTAAKPKTYAKRSTTSKSKSKIQNKPVTTVRITSSTKGKTKK